MAETNVGKIPLGYCPIETAIAPCRAPQVYRTERRPEGVGSLLNRNHCIEAFGVEPNAAVATEKAANTELVRHHMGSNVQT